MTGIEAGYGNWHCDRLRMGLIAAPSDCQQAGPESGNLVPSPWVGLCLLARFGRLDGQEFEGRDADKAQQINSQSVPSGPTAVGNTRPHVLSGLSFRSFNARSLGTNINLVGTG